jgi:hypothetical protein
MFDHPVKEMAVFVEAVYAVKHVAEMPVAGADKFHVLSISFVIGNSQYRQQKYEKKRHRQL